MATRRRVGKQARVSADLFAVLATYNRTVRDIELGLRARLWSRLIGIERKVTAIPSRILNEHWSAILQEWQS